MLLYRIGPEGLYAATDDEERLRFIFADPFERFPSSWEMGKTLESGPVGAMAPVLPGKIVAVGLNYQSHLGDREPAEYPGLFAKYPTSIVGPEAAIVMPEGASNLHYEAELVLVIGKEAKNVPVEDAADLLVLEEFYPLFH